VRLQNYGDDDDSHSLPAAQPPLKLRRVRRSLGEGGKPEATLTLS
jgi:hypothetical protein